MSILGHKQAPGSKIWKVIPELTLTQVVKATRPLENGQNDGSRNYPETGSAQFAETENRIVYEVENYLKSVDDLANKEFTDIIREAGPLSLADVDDDFSSLKQEAEKDFHRSSLTSVPELKKLRVAERRQLRDLKLFKERNNLDRLAKYPSSQVFNISLLALCLLVESCANMFYFSEGSPLGVLGGYLQAFGISAINIAASFAVGRLALSFMHHINKVKATIATCFFGLWLGVILVSHLLVAHYRDLLLIDPQNALLKTWDKFRDAPFGFESMDSSFVLIFGLVVAVVALIKGYRFDDVYPEYGARDRDYSKKADLLDNAEMVVRETMITSINKAEEQLSQRIKGYEAQAAKLGDLHVGAKSVIDHFDNIYSQVDEIVHSAVNTYREANLRIRTDEAPVTFTRMPVVQRLLRRDQFTNKLAELKELANATNERLVAMRKSASDILKSLAGETEMMSSRIEALTDEVDKKAGEQIRKDLEEI